MKVLNDTTAFYLPDYIFTQVHVMQEWREMYDDYVYRVYCGSKRVATFSGKYKNPISAEAFIESVIRNRGTTPELVTFRRAAIIGNTLKQAIELT